MMIEILALLHFCHFDVVFTCRLFATMVQMTSHTAHPFSRLSYLAHARIYSIFVCQTSWRGDQIEIGKDFICIKRIQLSNKQLITKRCASIKLNTSTTSSPPNSEIMNALNLISIATVWCLIFYIACVTVSTHARMLVRSVLRHCIDVIKIEFADIFFSLSSLFIPERNSQTVVSSTFQTVNRRADIIWSVLVQCCDELQNPSVSNLAHAVRNCVQIPFGLLLIKIHNTNSFPANIDRADSNVMVRIIFISRIISVDDFNVIVETFTIQFKFNSRYLYKFKPEYFFWCANYYYYYSSGGVNSLRQS